MVNVLNSFASPLFAARDSSTTTSDLPLDYQPGGPIILVSSTSSSSSASDTPLSYNPGGPIINYTSPASSSATATPLSYNPGGPLIPVSFSTGFNPGGPIIKVTPTGTALSYNPGGPLIPRGTSTASASDTPLSYNPGGLIVNITSTSTSVPSPTCTDVVVSNPVTAPINAPTCTYFSSYVTETVSTACGACATSTRVEGPGPVILCSEKTTLPVRTVTETECTSYATTTAS